MVSHESVLECLVGRLLSRGKLVAVHQEYGFRRGSFWRVVGEFDAIRIHYDSHGREWWTYYEVKSRHSDSALWKAWDQFLRAVRFFPDKNWHFVYYTPEKIMHYTVFSKEEDKGGL